jgi:hypothetical protein
MNSAQRDGLVRHRLRAAPALMTLLALLPGAAWADGPRTAVFPFELDDTSLQGSMQGENPDDAARLERLNSQLHDILMASGQYAPLALAADPHQPSLRTCDGCEIELARKADAKFAVTGWVQKVSNLILNINLVVRDVSTGQRVAGGSVDIRGDTDESWTRGLAYLLRNRILTTAISK